MLFLWIKTVYTDYSFVILPLKIIKMSLSEALLGMLALMPENQVLTKDIRLEVAIQDGRLEVREAKKPKKVTILL